jgi:hypothetical protein
MKLGEHLSAVWLNQLMLALWLTSGSFIAAMAQENAPLGCWRHESEEGRYKNFLEICLAQGGKAEILTFKNGSGWGRNARWQIGDNGTLFLVFSSNHKVTCKFSLADGSKLAFNECSIADYSRVFTRENTFGDSTTRNSICWDRQYPSSGDFEIAEIAERTPAIVELEHKQVSRDESYAEAGTIVVVWSRSGQYACVRSPTGIPDTDFWVDQKSLRKVPESVGGEDPWVGSYGQPSVVEIRRTSTGRYEVYGEIDHTLGDGPGWGYTISNEIFAHDAEPWANAIQLTLRRDISTAGPKAPADLTSPGFIDERCKPMLFVKGPVLLIKDTGECGDGSVFEDYWLRQP